MALSPQEIIKNQASIVFNGIEIKSNEVVAFNKVFPSVKKYQSDEYVDGNGTQTYTIKIRNNAAYKIEIPFYDDIPLGTEYIEGSFTVDGVVTEPIIKGDELSYVLNLEKFEQKTIKFQVKIQSVPPTPPVEEPMV